MHLFRQVLHLSSQAEEDVRARYTAHSPPAAAQMVRSTPRNEVNQNAVYPFMSPLEDPAEVFASLPLYYPFRFSEF